MTTSPCRAPGQHHASCLCALSGVVYNPPTDTAPVPAELPALQRVVLGHLAPDRGVTTSRLAQAMAQPHHTVQTALNALYAQGLIHRGTGGWHRATDPRVPVQHEDVRPWVLADGDSRCQDCGRPNPLWTADNALWNRVLTGDPDVPKDGVILCPTCFAAKADPLTRLGVRMVESTHPEDAAAQDLHRWAVAAEVAARYIDARDDDQAYRDLRTDVHAALCGLITPAADSWRAVQ